MSKLNDEHKKILNILAEGKYDFVYLDSLLTLSKSISQVIQSLNLEEIRNICNSFKCISDEINDIKNALSKNNDYLKYYIFGELNALFDVSSFAEESLIIRQKTNRALSNKTLMSMIAVLYANNTCTHAELANKLGITPQNLSMWFNRHPDWIDYVVVQSNYSKGSSVIYRLNASGHLIANESQKNYCDYIFIPEIDMNNERWKGNRECFDVYKKRLGGFKAWMEK